MASGTVIMVVGDTAAQTIELHNGQLQSRSVARTAVMGSWAFCGDVPLNIFLFRAVDRLVGAMGIPIQASLGLSAVKGVLFFAPGAALRNPMFLTYATAVEHGVDNWMAGRSPTADSQACEVVIRDKLSTDLWTILSDSARYWVPVNTLVFYCVPPAFRILSTSMFATVWLTYLSLVQHKPRNTR